MTQQPFAPQGYPAPAYPAPQQYAPPAPQQGYPAPVQQPYPPQQYAPAPVQQGYPAQQQFGQQAPAPAGPPPATGTLDEFYAQPSVGGGPSISWSDPQGQPKPVGTQYVGLVARDVTNSDVQQQTDFQTKAPLFYRDGRPKFSMKVPLQVQPSAEYPDGEASWYVKGQARDELQRAMSAAGVTGSPKAGDTIAITLMQRKPTGRGMNPANIVQVQYIPGTGQAPAAQAPVAAPVAQAPVAAPAPVQQYAPPAPVQVAPVQQVQQYAAPAPVAAPVAAPAAPAAGVPDGFNADQAALLARLTGQQ